MTKKRIGKLSLEYFSYLQNWEITFDDIKEVKTFINGRVYHQWRYEREEAKLLWLSGFVFLIFVMVGIFFSSLNDVRFDIISFAIKFIGFLILILCFIFYLFDYLNFKEYKKKYHNESEFNKIDSKVEKQIDERMKEIMELEKKIKDSEVIKNDE